ncbi:MAG: hypothetical protein IME98_02855, partial [Proteobacteria bacterium]|nr:hypothetical protein [Pseudomonadota bacterium]
MKRLFISCMIILFATSAFAVERKALKEVDSDSFTTDTQVSFKATGDDNISIAWWIPNEFWMSLFARDTSTSDADKQAMLDSLSGVSLLAIVQADISPLGAFDFYSKDEIEKKVELLYVNGKGNNVELQ